VCPRNTTGELASYYSIASVAFVGGSLIPAGGHNPLEPAQFGVPIVMGPHYANFRAITEDLLDHQAIRIAARADLAQVLAGLLANPAEAKAMGERARQVFEQQAGATGRCVEAIRGLLGYAPPAPALARAASEHRARTGGAARWCSFLTRSPPRPGPSPTALRPAWSRSAICASRH
jgi:hypothetical protein